MRMMLLRLIMTLMMVSIMITWMIIDDDDRLCTSFCDATFQPLNPGKVLAHSTMLELILARFDQRGRFKSISPERTHETTMRHHSYKRRPPEGIAGLERLFFRAVRCDLSSHWHHLFGWLHTTRNIQIARPTARHCGFLFKVNIAELGCRLAYLLYMLTGEFATSKLIPKRRPASC